MGADSVHRPQMQEWAALPTGLIDVAGQGEVAYGGQAEVPSALCLIPNLARHPPLP